MECDASAVRGIEEELLKTDNRADGRLLPHSDLWDETGIGITDSQTHTYKPYLLSDDPKPSRIYRKRDNGFCQHFQ